MGVQLTLKAWRRARNLSQENLAEYLGVSLRTYFKWELNPQKISVENAIKISELFGVPLSDIIFLPDTPSKLDNEQIATTT